MTMHAGGGSDDKVSKTKINENPKKLIASFPETQYYRFSNFERESQAK